MILTSTLTKKILEKLIYHSFYRFGEITSSSLLDSLKLLGFYHATQAGLSITLEDLKTPIVKDKVIGETELEISTINHNWQVGTISDIERFQAIIDNWNSATESLKNKIINYYQDYDPVNSLFIMAFSGARGNMSQVRQLIGMRGLMSDQEGKIIDLPIQTNFREGLTSIDYLISSYGARKGIVDTALKTADSGYLTRRLIYVAQDLIIRELDCKTQEGIFISTEQNQDYQNLLGRIILDFKGNSLKEIKKDDFLNKILDLRTLKKMQRLTLSSFLVRSSLTCKSLRSICQACYGWDLAKTKLVSLGQAVGILAAQSIGEPGTQLTMRTFHTGGIFTSELLKQMTAPFSGTLIFPERISSQSLLPFRTTQGRKVFRVQQELKLLLKNWTGTTKELTFEIGSFLYLSTSSFVKKGQILSESATQSSFSVGKKLKPIYGQLEGEIKFEDVAVQNLSGRNNSLVKVNLNEGIMWLSSAKLFPIPLEAKFYSSKKFRKKKAFASINLVTPFASLFFKNEEEKYFSLKTSKKEFTFFYSTFLPEEKNYQAQFLSFAKNYQYLDPYTILGSYTFFPSFEERIYLIRKKELTQKNLFFVITESDIWKLNLEEGNYFSLSSKDLRYVKTGQLITKTKKIKNSGFLLKKDGFRFIFQKAFPLFLSHGSILYTKNGDFIEKNQLIATLLTSTQQTEDIVQGLPKIEEIIEARIPIDSAIIAKRPGIFLPENFGEINYFQLKKKNTLLISILDIIKRENKEDEQTKKEILKQSFYFLTSFLTENLITFLVTAQKTNLSTHCFNGFWEMYLFPSSYQFNVAGKNYCFQNQQNSSENYQETKYRVVTKRRKRHWDKTQAKSTWIMYPINDNLLPKKTWSKSFSSEQMYLTSENEWIKVEKNYSLLLNKFIPIEEYRISTEKKMIRKVGELIDLAEPLTTGPLNPHELLSVLFYYHCLLDGTIKACLKSLTKFQLILLNSIQAIYDSQGVEIDNRHVEIIVRQMTSKTMILESGDTPFVHGEMIPTSFLLEICSIFSSLDEGQSQSKTAYKIPEFEPLFLSSTSSSLLTESFLSAAGFQETKKVLTKAAIEGNLDWLEGLKESIIVGRLIPAGSSFLLYKQNLDNFYKFTKKYQQKSF